ncbi:neuraminidase-like domain-containing protein [Pseudomonas chlororaphis]|uniref:Tc toxin subunit A-related protein n=1 Tax=Pseudomonas chlororaphis TaxID=587753 RepID=UPI0039E08755
MSSKIPSIFKSVSEQLQSETLSEIALDSFEQFREKIGQSLSWREADQLYQMALAEKKKNALYEKRQLTRANPQLRSAIRLGRGGVASSADYSTMFGGRDSEYVAPGDVASMFSPAAYLTELYREALGLHSVDSVYHLDRRRPDLQNLVLSQNNMDAELSTLTLSNALLMAGIRQQTGQDHNQQVLELLSTWRLTGQTPYHSAFETVRKTLLTQDPGLRLLRSSPNLAAAMEPVTLLGIETHISPDLYALLTEVITLGNVEALYIKNFDDMSMGLLADPDYLSKYYGVSQDDVVALARYLGSESIKSETNSDEEGSTLESSQGKIRLLMFNKLIRLFKVTGLSLLTIERVVDQNNQEQTVNAAVLDQVCRTLDYVQRYALSEDEALILVGAEISQQAENGGPSQFDQLFNSPPLAGMEYVVDDSLMNLLPNDLGDESKKNSLKRAFAVDNSGLYQLCLTAKGERSGIVRNDIETLSGLYLTKLLADSHALSVYELDRLLSITGYDQPMLSMSEVGLSEMCDVLYATTQWLSQQQWSVRDLLIMVTTTYSTTLTPEIENLTATLLSGLQSATPLSGDELKAAMAPFIASALQLPSTNVAYDLLLWADQVSPAGITTDTFWQQVQSDSADENVIIFSQALAQLSLIYQNVALSEPELSLVVRAPGILNARASTLGHDLATLKALTGFHAWINSLGDNASEGLAAISQDSLTPVLMAQVMGIDTVTLELAAGQVAGELTTFSSWSEIDTVLQWLNLAQALHVSPNDVAALLALRYGENQTYSQWQAVAEALLAGVDHTLAGETQALLAEQLSSALSEYTLHDIVDPGLKLQDRNGLYGYLLMDNQVSAEVMTTPIAEAIASVQLYVNRALNGAEAGAQSATMSRQFFVDWERYNKRYSSWAGVSQLVYYPENYIDPTQRIGQTQMMGALLQSVNQSQLTTDTVEDAFKAYLTSFEAIANLQVISAYHDDVNIEQGLTYFVGSSKAAPGDYYWRSADHDKFSTGEFPANAWVDWQKIDCAINPYLDVLRPVVYKSRLYLLWLERQETTSYETPTYNFTLKLAQLRYDGTWSAPVDFNANDYMSTLELGSSEAPGLYCAGYQGEDTLLVILYKKTTNKNYIGPWAKLSGLYIYEDLSSERMANVQDYVGRVYEQFDNPTQRRVNNRYAEFYEVPATITQNSGALPGAYRLTTVLGGKLASISIEESTSSVLKLKIRPQIRIAHGGGAEITDVRTAQLALMKRYGQMGDTFILYDNVTSNEDNSIKDDVILAPLYQYSGGESKNAEGRFLVYRDVSYPQTLRIWQSDDKELRLEDAPPYYAYLDATGWPTKRFKDYIYLEAFQALCLDKTACSVEGAVDVDTTIKPEKIVASILINGRRQIFSAKNYCSSLPIPSFEEMLYAFDGLVIDASDLVYINNMASVTVTFTGQAEDGRFLGSETFIIPVTRQNADGGVICLLQTEEGAQYMQMDCYRVRLNTLFARELVSRANAGIDTVLCMETQNINEPQLGQGSFVKVALPRYNKVFHGGERKFSIYLGNLKERAASRLYYEGDLMDEESLVMLFIPYSEDLYDFDVASLAIKFSIPSESVGGEAYFRFDKDKQRFFLINDPDASPESMMLDVGAPLGKYQGFTNVMVLTDYQESMDFNGANALYFWELFYYTPMLIALRLLQERSFDEAARWFKYIWSPSGYLVNGQQTDYIWNVRPLLEDTSWNSDPLDSIDPDAVAQADPMHYKVATFMRTLDLLIARGDDAYRQQQQDALAEAKMWYVQALTLLGDEPQVVPSDAWPDPTLGCAASQTLSQAHQKVLTHLRSGIAPTGPMILTANTLVNLFLPQENEQLKGYWQMLSQRMYNLRHNLSIDGQPLLLPLYATPADPKALQSAAVAASQGGPALPQVPLTVYRFPQVLERARNLVTQLSQYGSTLLSIIERQDAEALGQLLQTQATELMLTSISLQDQTILELDAEKTVLAQSLSGARQRFDSYIQLYDENINAGEAHAMDLHVTASESSLGAQVLHTAAAAADLVPNIFGLAAGGSRWGGISTAVALGLELSASCMMVDANKVTQSETYRRRRQDWGIQRDNAASEVKQLEAQAQQLDIRCQAAQMQKSYLETQQAQIQAQLTFLKQKFSSQALYNWLRGRLSAVYFQFYDLTVAACMMAEKSYRWETSNEAASFIKPGAWQGTYAGLLCGEALMTNLVQMEMAYQVWDSRALEVERTISLAQVYATQLEVYDGFGFEEHLNTLLQNGSGHVGGENNGIVLDNDLLAVTVSLSSLKLEEDYPESMSLGKTRRIKQVSVSLPVILGPYQNIQATLSYAGSRIMPAGCTAIAVSSGMNDSGQFLLNFNDEKYLPFEGITIEDEGVLILRFPHAGGKQKALLQSLSDIILHLRYTIR